MTDKRKKCPVFGSLYNIPVKFYLYNKYLGAGFVPEQSTREHRRECARKLGIHFYNGLIFENRDMRKFTVVTKTGKKRRDVDFIHPSDFPKSILLTGSEPISKRQMKKLRKSKQ